MENGYLSRLVWEARCDKFWDGGDSADAVRRAGLAGTRKILCMIKNSDFEDWFARASQSAKLVGRCASGLAIELYDWSDVRLGLKGQGRPGLGNVNVLRKAFHDPDFDPRDNFLCTFLDPSYGPYADATIRVPFELRLLNPRPAGGRDDVMQL